MATKEKKKPKYIYRSAKSGKIVEPRQNYLKPNTTVKERVKPSKLKAFKKWFLNQSWGRVLKPNFAQMVIDKIDELEKKK